MYGIQTFFTSHSTNLLFENDVKMYGIQTEQLITEEDGKFENDVKMYGIQTDIKVAPAPQGLRMM